MQVIFKSVNNKKGEELVEATMVLPIVIIITFIIIRFSIYYYQILDTRVNLHRDILNEAYSNSYHGLNVIEKEEKVEFIDEFILFDPICYNIKASYFKYNETDIVMAGDIIE